MQDAGMDRAGNPGRAAAAVPSGIVLYGDIDSGNCIKVLIAAVRGGVPFRWRPVDTAYGTPREAEVERLNRAGQVPFLRFPDGRVIAQSGAIMLYLLRDTPFVPADPFHRAKVHEWMFWEQYSHEPYIAVCRSMMRYQGVKAEDREGWRVDRGERALDVMDERLSEVAWMADVAGSPSGPTTADIALFAYTRWAEDGGFDLEPCPNVRRWLGDCERAFADELAVMEWIRGGRTLFEPGTAT